jgi:hypothetical protein
MPLDDESEQRLVGCGRLLGLASDQYGLKVDIGDNTEEGLDAACDGGLDGLDPKLDDIVRGQREQRGRAAPWPPTSATLQALGPRLARRRSRGHDEPEGLL